MVSLRLLALFTIFASSSMMSSVNAQAEEQCDDPAGVISNLPSKDMAVGVEQNLVQLCATISGATYTGASKDDFKDLLLGNASIKKAYPDLVVRFYQNGVTFGKNGLFGSFSFNPPTFAAITSGDMLILAWRGSVTIRDFIADASIDSIGPWKAHPELEVQRAYFQLMKNYLKHHYKDIINWVNGNYSMVPNKNAKDGTKIKRIILTGHSLGGGIAQVAHLSLTAPIKALWKDMVAQIKSNDVVVKTISISAPMTTVFKGDTLSKETQEYLKIEVAENMCNFLYRTDIVPRGYSHLDFIHGFVKAFGNEMTKEASGVAVHLAEAFVRFANRAVTDKDGGLLTQASKYRHVGKLVYYSKPDAEPLAYMDNLPGIQNKYNDFGTLRYAGPPENVAEHELENHMFLVTGPGLTFG